MRQQVAIRVSRMVAMWQIAESWCRSVAKNRLYFAANWGSVLRAWSAAVNTASRSSGSPALVSPC